jgi:hypothetical protein
MFYIFRRPRSGGAKRGVLRTSSRGAQTLCGLAIPLLSVYLIACGGDSHMTSSTATPSTAATSTASKTTITVPAKPYIEAHRPPSADRGTESFRVSHGDNSVLSFGQAANASQQQEAAAVLTAFMRARAAGAWSEMCPYIARATRRPLEAIVTSSRGKVASCGSALAALITGPAAERADTFTNGLAVLRIKGNTAFALFHGPNDGKYVMPLRSEGGAWKVTQLAPVTYPIGTPAAAP